jgi:hypothetical protein
MKRFVQLFELTGKGRLDFIRSKHQGAAAMARGASSGHASSVGRLTAAGHTDRAAQAKSDSEREGKKADYHSAASHRAVVLKVAAAKKPKQRKDFKKERDKAKTAHHAARAAAKE